MKMIVRDVIEIDEAIEAGERVLDRVDEVLDYLDSARNWGIFDMLSRGGFISAMIKHSKLEKAEGVMYDLQDEIRRFNDELDDIRLPELPEVKMDEFMKFADIFLDNPIVDFMALSHISDSKKQLERLAVKVEDIINELRHIREEY